LWILGKKYSIYGYGFSEGLASVVVGDKFTKTTAYPKRRWQGGQAGYINSLGEMVIKHDFDIGFGFHDGLARVEIDSDTTTGKTNWGYIDKKGNLKFKAPFDFCGLFSEGMAAVGNKYPRKKGKSGKTPAGTKTLRGFIDKTGKVAVELEYDEVSNFSEGLAAFYKDGKRGYIDKNGKVIIETGFEKCASFSEGLASFYKNGKCGYINKTGKIVIEPIFLQANTFSEGVAKVAFDSTGTGVVLINSVKIGYIDLKGKVIWKDESVTEDQFILVYITQTTKKYHKARCNQLAKDDDEVIDLKKARSEYSACAVCKPPQ